MLKKTVRYPLQALDAGDGASHVCDGEGVYILYQNRDMSLNQWKFVVDVLNKAGENGRFIPEK